MRTPFVHRQSQKYLPARRVRQTLAAGLAALVLVGTVSGCQSDNGASTDAGTWAGHTYGRVVRDDARLMSATYSWRGDFAFRVDDQGKIHGHGTVTYHPTFDASGVNAMILRLKGEASTVLAGLPFGIGELSSMELSDTVAVTASYAHPMPVRAGSISGTLRDGKLHLHWDKLTTGGGHNAGEFKNIPVSVYLQLTNYRERKQIYHGYLPIDEPWPGTATQQDAGVPSCAAAGQPKPSTNDGVTTTKSFAWDAHRTG